MVLTLELASPSKSVRRVSRRRPVNGQESVTRYRAVEIGVTVKGMTAPDALPSVGWTEVFDSIEVDAFEELALLAGEVSRAPIAMVTLVDDDRQWFTSVTGAHISAGPWEQTFCAHAVQQRTPFVVPDATRDPRFATNPLVQSAPYVRFYAGAPLITGASVVGTLCVMDVAPRGLEAESAAGLQALARQVVMQLELRRQTRQLARLNEALALEAIERRRTEQRLRDSELALRRSQNDLHQIDADRRTLVANISHDLRTPLTALQGYLDTVLLKGGSLPPSAHRYYVEQASVLSRRLARLVSDLFELAQLEDCRVELKAERFELTELISDVVQTFASVAEARSIVLGVSVVDRPIVVAGEIRLIERVLENLLDNAIRFTPAGGEVSVSCAPSADRVTVRVKDTGPGISIPDQEQLFDRFYRGCQPVDVPMTTAGLGLSITKRIVELHRGEITVASGTGKGAEFVFSLPVCRWIGA